MCINFLGDVPWHQRTQLDYIGEHQKFWCICPLYDKNGQFQKTTFQNENDPKNEDNIKKGKCTLNWEDDQKKTTSKE